MTSDPAVALAQAFRRQLARDQDAGSVMLAAYQVAASELAAAWPQLDQIAACYSSPGSGCLCDVSGWIHQGEPQEPPAWLAEAREVKAAAEVTLQAIAVAMSGPDITDIGKIGLSDGRSLGEWLANLYRTDRDGLFRTFAVLRNDPGSQDAIAEARRLIFGDQPPAAPPAPPPGHQPAIPRLSHAAVRNSIPLEGHRFRHFGSGAAPPPPEPPEP
jgi:hypothetical protein